jgi:putative flippase GtrA
LRGLSADLRVRARRVARFGLVGVLNTGLDFTVFALLFYGLGWPLLAANSLAYLAGLANSYLLNSRWTFGDRPGRRSPARPLLYAGLNCVGLLLGNFTVWSLAVALPAWLAKLGATGVTFAWNYWSSDRLVFARGRR